MVWVIGAVCVDLVAVKDRYIDGTSNPAQISLSLGGVGYRIFRRLPQPRRFITAIGSDPLSAYAARALEACGGATVRTIDCGPPVYLALMEGGRLKVGASDVGAVERGLDPGWVSGPLSEAADGDVLVLEGNLSPELVRSLMERYSGRLRTVFEPVSVEKAIRHRGFLRGCSLATPTAEEAAALVRGVAVPGVAFTQVADGEVLAYIGDMGLGAMLVTLGPAGTALYAGGARTDYPPERVVDAPDTTGAGDLLTAALIGFLSGGMSVADALRPAMRRVESALEEGIL